MLLCGLRYLIILSWQSLGTGISFRSFTISVLYLSHRESAIIWLHLQLLNFVCSIHLGSVAMSYTCTLWTRSYFCYICIKWIHFRGHLIKPWHQHLCFAGRVLLPVYVCIESNKYSFWWGLILPSLAYTICQLLHIMKEYQTCIFIPLDLIFRVLSIITFICFLFILNFLNWFTTITYILNALTESLHAIFQFLKTKYNVFKH